MTRQEQIQRFFHPQARFWAAFVLLVFSVIMWPVSQFTWAKEEPPFILALSWGAIIVTCIDIIATTDVRKEIEKEGTK